jgi:hypothetical protein
MALSLVRVAWHGGWSGPRSGRADRQREGTPTVDVAALRTPANQPTPPVSAPSAPRVGGATPVDAIRAGLRRPFSARPDLRAGQQPAWVEHGLYQLIRQSRPCVDDRLRIELLDPCAGVFFTFL